MEAGRFCADCDLHGGAVILAAVDRSRIDAVASREPARHEGIGAIVGVSKRIKNDHSVAQLRHVCSGIRFFERRNDGDGGDRDRARLLVN